MHSLTHYTASIRDKGVVANSGTDCGEGLHPQEKKNYGHTNRQKTAEDQVHLSLLLLHEDHLNADPGLDG